MNESDFDWRRDDYERSCEYATRVMRSREVEAGRIVPKPGDYDSVPSPSQSTKET